MLAKYLALNDRVDAFLAGLFAGILFFCLHHHFFLRWQPIIWLDNGFVVFRKLFGLKRVASSDIEKATVWYNGTTPAYLVLHTSNGIVKSLRLNFILSDIDTEKTISYLTDFCNAAGIEFKARLNES